MLQYAQQCLIKQTSKLITFMMYLFPGESIYPGFHIILLPRTEITSPSSWILGSILLDFFDDDIFLPSLWGNGTLYSFPWSIVPYFPKTWFLTPLSTAYFNPEQYNQLGFTRFPCEVSFSLVMQWLFFCSVVYSPSTVTSA